MSKENENGYSYKPETVVQNYSLDKEYLFNLISNYLKDVFGLTAKAFDLQYDHDDKEVTLLVDVLADLNGKEIESNIKFNEQNLINAVLYYFEKENIVIKNVRSFFGCGVDLCFTLEAIRMPIVEDTEDLPKKHVK